MKKVTPLTQMRKLKNSFVWYGLFLFAGCAGEEVVEPIVLHAIAGSEGQLVWLASPEVSDLVALQGFDGSQWLNVSMDVADGEWFVPAANDIQAFRCLREDDSISTQVVPTQLQTVFGASADQQVFLGNEEAEISAAILGLEEYPLQIKADLVVLRDDQATRKDSNNYPLVASEVENVNVLTASDAHLAWQLQGEEERVGQEELLLNIIFETKSMGEVVLSQKSLVLVFVGFEIYWGDLHGHSNLSVDACEDGTSLCGDQTLIAGGDYFLNAKKNGLDFAAITEHAEYIAYAPDGTQSTKVGIWSTQAEHVRAAADDSFVSILGYEWTDDGAVDDERTGGHRTVLFDADSLCDEYFVGSGFASDHSKYFGTGTYYGQNSHFSDSILGLQAGLLKASQICGPAQFLMFAHHSALVKPQHVDWRLPQNKPNPEVEMLIEIFSEHGSSELLNPEEEGAFGVDPSKVYAPEGSVQQALMLGYQLGFVGGTDNHDGRPGSLSDGPSCPDYWNQEGPICQFHGGALTGVLGGELSRSHIFSGLNARRTVVTTGPKELIRAVMVGISGDGYPVGALLPADDAPYKLYLDTTGSETEVVNRELVLSSGEILVLPTASTLTIDTLSEHTDWAYLRLSVKDSESEHRIWLSPWFWE